MRLRGDFSTACDPIHTGFVEVFHAGEWGAICVGDDNIDRLAADVVCRQLGYPHGTMVDGLFNVPDYDRFYRDYPVADYETYPYVPGTEENQLPQDRFWLNTVNCRGPEGSVLDCDLGQGFLSDNEGCNPSPVRLTVACRTFPVGAALEEETTPGAGAL